MIAMPFHPSNVYTIDELNANLSDILHDVEQKALVSLDGAVEYSLQDKIRDGKLYVDQGIIAGCAGGGFENICAAADIIKGHNIGSDAFTFSVYPASTPIYMELVKNGAVLTDNVTEIHLFRFQYLFNLSERLFRLFANRKIQIIRTKSSCYYFPAHTLKRRSCAGTSGRSRS